ncbi:MAG: MFS transporter [Clostridiales bacterium]|nr:MFS transporter [Clostridiales bacterium]
MKKINLIFIWILTALLSLGFTGHILNMVFDKGRVLILTALIISVMVVFEMAALPGAAKGRRRTDAAGDDSLNSLIKWLTFFTYLAAYAVIPYGAVIIKYDGAKLLGLSKDFLASLPASLLCVGIFTALLMGKKAKELLGIRLYMILTGFCGILPMYICFMKLKTPQILISSFLIGFCLGLERWLMNYFVAVSSDSEKDTTVKYGYYNCGLLAGLTIGGALGGIISYARGYRYVYFAGGITIFITYAIGVFVLPYLYIKKREGIKTVKREIKSMLPFIREVFKRPALVMDILTAAVPLNMGLMFIVSFLHILIAMRGLNSTVNTYSYILYGFTGNYLGIYIVKRLKHLNENKAGFIALMFIFLSVVVLIPKVTLPGILICAALAGLFDGYGGAVLTSLPVNSKNAEGIDKGIMLNGLAVVGSVVSALAPIIYGGLLNLGSFRINLTICAAFFALSGLWILKKR